MKILIAEPFFDGSHRQWAEGYQSASRHRIELLTLPGRHWKWRMTSGALGLADRSDPQLHRPDLILASDMLDLPAFLGLTREWSAGIPSALYFHENQLAYPGAPGEEEKERDRHYAFKNFLSAVAADHLFFNSDYNRRSFLEGLEKLLRVLPDSRETLRHIRKIEARSTVLPLGMDLRRFDAFQKNHSNDTPVILWNHRWEHDKAPEAFFELLYRLKAAGEDFRLLVLGASFREVPDCFGQARQHLGDRILHFGYASEFKEYARLLWQADLLPVTSRQDFFGGSVVEALYCHCRPLLPDRLAYPEHIPLEWRESLLYDDLEDLFHKMRAALRDFRGNRLKLDFQNFVAHYDWSILAPLYDRHLEKVVAGDRYQ